MTDKIWNFLSTKLNDNEVNSLSLKYRIPRIVSAILLNRGIDSEQIGVYLKKSMADIINPTLMLDMDKAVSRITKAIENKEKTVVYGDYDVDGITATALLYEFLQSAGADVEYYIPDRKDEGYGINIMAVNKLYKRGVKLIITVDCGITAIGEVEFAKLQGMDVVITDHHTCKDRLPEAAAAILNPKREDCEYPFDALAGVGVAFKLALALAMELGMNTGEIFKKYADLAAIGTIADVVPLLGENRIIVDKGLREIQSSPRLGIKALLEISGITDKPIDSSSIAFTVSPRLNAAGRLGSASTSVELLLTKDAARAEEIAQELDNENRERQRTEQDILDEALELIAADPNFNKKKVIVLAKEGWHHGVIGIVASKLCEMYYKPCILISHSNGIGKGSGRSIPAFNLFDALSHCEKHLVEFGGHAVAAGLNINMSDLDDFIKEINKYADASLTEKDMIPSINIDCPVSERAITLENAYMLSKLEPFGMSNPKPVFAIANMRVTAIDTIGADSKHLRMRAERNGVTVNCIGFGMSNFAEFISRSDLVNLAFQMNVNRYRDVDSVQLLLKDIKKKQA